MLLPEFVEVSSVQGPISLVIEGMEAGKRTRLLEACKAALTTEDGAILMELLEKAVFGIPLPADTRDSALRENNGMRILVHELRRLVHGRRADRTDRPESRTRR